METESAAEKIRRNQRMKQILAQIVENLKDYFDELQIKKFGEKSRYIALDQISSIHKVGSKGLQLVTAIFNTDLGDLKLSIALKSFDSPEEAARNKILTNRLSTKLRNTGMLTPRVIFEHGKILIYEGIQGETFLDSELEHDRKLFLTGEALSQYHTTELRPIDPQRYIFIAKNVFNELIMTPERKKKFIDRASETLARVITHSSGTAGFGDFHPGNVLFSIEKNDDNGKEGIQTWLIDPEYVEEEDSADRMEDIGTFFLHSAIDHFDRDGNLQAFVSRELSPFIQGYEEYLTQKDSFQSLDAIYGDYEIALAFHLGLNVLLEGLFLQKRADMNNEAAFDRMSTCVTLANYCWKHGLE